MYQYCIPFMAKKYPINWIYYILFIHLSVDVYLTCSPFLANVIDAAMNICLQVLGGRMFLFLLGVCLGVELQGPIGLCTSFSRCCQTLLHFAFPTARFCFVFIDPRGTGGCFRPGGGSWGPQSHKHSDRRENGPGTFSPGGRGVHCALSWSVQAASHRWGPWT